jgi:cell cycle checkpoint protein
MSKPRAARKKPIVLSSDDESGRDSPPPPKRPRRGTLISLSSTSQTRRAASPKTQSLPAALKSPSKSPGKPKVQHKPITSFFSNVPPPQTTQPTPSPEKSATSTPLDDIDDILDSEDDRPLKQPTLLPVRKRGKDAALNAPPKGSQKFLKAADGARSTPPPSLPAPRDAADMRPWNEKYGPVSLDELAVHKRKVADIRTWLSNVFNGRERKRLLLLKGAAGSGKTTTVSLLSKELGFDIHEWKNPAGSVSSSEGFVSITAQFADFVARAGAFGSLAFEEPLRTRQSQPTPSTPDRQKQLILVEEFPNTFARASSAVQSFRSSVLNFLAANTPSATSFFGGKQEPDQPITPIVMIISETLLSTSTAAADSFTAHRLLGPEILTHPGATVIEFNAIAPTFMTKALDLVIVKEARKSGRKKTVGPQVIQRLAELGDIRSAVSSLEFLCVRGDEDERWGAKVSFTKKKGSKDTPMTKMEQESLEMVTQRESTLGIFHSVGRVVYNKRIPETLAAPPIPQPPSWFPERRRPKASEVNVNTLIDELGTDTQTFIAALHENYVLSCEGADSEETMDSLEGCIDAVSDADLLSPDRFGNGFSGRTFQGTSADNLRQEEMSFQVSVHGLLYNLPFPVKRIAPPSGIMGVKGKNTGGKGNAFVMYYPASLRIWRTQEELGGLLDMWISRAQRGELFTSNSALPKPVGSGTGGVDTWKRSTPFSQPAKNTQSQHVAQAPQQTSKDDETPPPILLGSGGSARYEMLLERLPYLPHILRNSSIPSSTTASTIRDIRKLTAFTGNSISATTDEDEDGNEAETGELEQWATDRPDSPKKKRGNRIEAKKKEIEADVVENDVRNLVLSDDDIED